MGTKALARTIIEGGRTPRNIFERRHSNGQARAAERAFTDALRADEDRWADACAPTRTKVGVWQADKLGAPRRWLRAQRGRRWDDVYADIRARFDTRTIPGHHIVFDHLLREVDFGHVHGWHHFRDGLFVDEDGRLQMRARRHRSRTPRWASQPPQRLLAWLGERRIGRRGAAWYWFVARPFRDRLAYRQAHRLDASEVRFWESFTDAQRSGLTLVFDEDGRLAGAAT